MTYSLRVILLHSVAIWAACIETVFLLLILTFQRYMINLPLSLRSSFFYFISNYFLVSQYLFFNENILYTPTEKHYPVTDKTLSVSLTAVSTLTSSPSLHYPIAISDI